MRQKPTMAPIKDKSPMADAPAITPLVAQQLPAPDPKWSCLACAHYLITATSCIKDPPAAFWGGKFDDKGSPIVVSAFPQMNPWGKCFQFVARDTHPLGNATSFDKAAGPEANQ